MPLSFNVITPPPAWKGAVVGTPKAGVPALLPGRPLSPAAGALLLASPEVPSDPADVPNMNSIVSAQVSITTRARQVCSGSSLAKGCGTADPWDQLARPFATM